jgi:hypothetical protein
MLRITIDENERVQYGTHVRIESDGQTGKTRTIDLTLQQVKKAIIEYIENNLLDDDEMNAYRTI